MDILVFATNIQSVEVAGKVENLLKQLPNIAQVNFDLEDWENILRVEAQNISEKEIERLLMNHGFACKALE